MSKYPTTTAARNFFQSMELSLARVGSSAPRRVPVCGDSLASPLARGECFPRRRTAVNRGARPIGGCGRGEASVADLRRDAGVPDGQELLAPRLMGGVFRIAVSRLAVLKLDDEGGVVIPRLHPRRLQPDVFDAGDLRGQLTDAVEHLLLFRVGHIGLPLDQRDVDDRLRRAEIVFRGSLRSLPAAKKRSGTKNRRSGQRAGGQA